MDRAAMIAHLILDGRTPDDVEHILWNGFRRIYSFGTADWDLFSTPDIELVFNYLYMPFGTSI